MYRPGITPFIAAGFHSLRPHEPWSVVYIHMFDLAYSWLKDRQGLINVWVGSDGVACAEVRF